MPLQERNNFALTLRNVDWVTVVVYLLMVIAGAISIYAASYDFDEASIFSFDESVSYTHLTLPTKLEV